MTKLVKNARKEYLAKYIKEKKEGDVTANAGEASAPPGTSSSDAAKPSTGSGANISATQSNYMMNLYNSFFNQYMQQYTQHKAAASTDGDYDSLKQQAAFYAQQQHSIQQQLETCLANTTQQFLGELAASSHSMPSAPPPAAPYAMPYHYKMTS